MAADPNPELRMELEAALAELEPQIRGLEDLIKHTASPELITLVNERLNDLIQRRGLIQTALNQLDQAWESLDKLEADGYPGHVQASIEEPLYGELEAELYDMQAACDLFVLSAAQIHVNLGQPKIEVNLGQPTTRKK